MYKDNVIMILYGIELLYWCGSFEFKIVKLNFKFVMYVILLKVFVRVVVMLVYFSILIRYLVVWYDMYLFIYN